MAPSFVIILKFWLVYPALIGLLLAPTPNGWGPDFISLIAETLPIKLWLAGFWPSGVPP